MESPRLRKDQAAPTLYLLFLGAGGGKGSGNSSINKLCQRCQDGGPIRLLEIGARALLNYPRASRRGMASCMAEQLPNDHSSPVHDERFN